jgi:hypothetical protein
MESWRELEQAPVEQHAVAARPGRVKCLIALRLALAQKQSGGGLNPPALPQHAAAPGLGRSGPSASEHGQSGLRCSAVTGRGQSAKRPWRAVSSRLLWDAETFRGLSAGLQACLGAASTAGLVTRWLPVAAAGSSRGQVAAVELQWELQRP